MSSQVPDAANMRRFRRARFSALRWLLSKTQTGRAVLWNEWLNGMELQKQIARDNAELDAEEFEGGYPWPNL